MNRSLVLLLSFLAPLSLLAQKDAAEPSVLELIDGTVLKGTLEGMDNSDRLQWRQSPLLQPTLVPRSAIHKVRSAPTSQEYRNGNDVNVQLTNGDLLRGQFQALTDHHLAFKSSSFGELKLRKSMVSRISFPTKGSTLHGFEKLDKWTITGNDAFKLESDQLYALRHGMVTRALELPDRFQVSCDLTWNQNLQLGLFLLSDDGEHLAPDNCYQVLLQNSLLSVRKRWTDAKTYGSQLIGQGMLPKLATAGNQLHLDVCVDRGRFSVFVGGIPVGQWEDPDPTKGVFGKWFHVLCKEGPLTISRLRISPWNGDPPKIVIARAPTTSNDEAELNHQVVGLPVEIKDDELVVRSASGPINLQLDHISHLKIVGEYEEPIRKKGDVRAWTKTGERLTFRLDGTLNGALLEGYSDLFGHGKFPLSSLKRIEFNLYDKDLRSAIRAQN